MATDSTSRPGGRRRDRGRVPYRLTVAQVLAMREAGILGDEEDVELWGGTLYQLVKPEPHNDTVATIAEALRPLIPAGYHVREEKPTRREPHFLAEPDVAVARGDLRSYGHSIPSLDRLALVVEVCDGTRRADFGTKSRGYARSEIPFYWVVDLRSRQIVVLSEPKDLVRFFGYAIQTRFGAGESLDVVIDGNIKGQLLVDDLLPPPAPKG